MPIPIQLLFTFASGVLIALAARGELRGSPKALVLSPALGAYLLYAALVVVPASLYFYLFHGDWYLLYLVDSQRVPSALVLLACLLQVALGAAGFLLGARFVRNQREPWAGATIGLATALAAAAIPMIRHRFGVVGTYAQYHGDFGLSPFGGPLLYGVLCMSLWMLVGLVYLAYRIGPGARRG